MKMTTITKRSGTEFIARRAGKCVGCHTQLFDYGRKNQATDTFKCELRSGRIKLVPFGAHTPVNQAYRLSSHETDTRRVCGRCKLLMQK